MLLSRETRVKKLFKILLQVAKGRVQNRVAGRCSAPPRIDPGGDARNNPPPPFPAPPPTNESQSTTDEAHQKQRDRIHNLWECLSWIYSETYLCFHTTFHSRRLGWHDTPLELPHCEEA